MIQQGPAPSPNRGGRGVLSEPRRERREAQALVAECLGFFASVYINLHVLIETIMQQFRIVTDKCLCCRFVAL